MKFITLVPTNLNDGSPVSEDEMQDILLQFPIRFGGATIEGPIEGHWIDDDSGKHYQDSVLRVTVVCDSKQLKLARQLVIAIGRQLDQKVMYFEVIKDDGVEFLKIQD